MTVATTTWRTSSIFGVAPLEWDEEEEETREERRRRAAAVTAPLRPSKRVGPAIKEEGQGRAGVLTSGSCLPPGTSWTRELLLLFLARALTCGYECTRVREYGVTTAFRRQVRTYVRTYSWAGIMIGAHHLADAASRTPLRSLSRTNPGYFSPYGAV